MRIAGDDGVDTQRLREVAQLHVAVRVASLVRALKLHEEPVPAESAGKLGGRVRLTNGQPSRAQPDRQTSPSFSSASSTGSSAGGTSSTGLGLVPACAEVSNRQRFAYPCAVSTSSVTCAPPRSVTSAPVIGRTPSAFAACANSREP